MSASKLFCCLSSHPAVHRFWASLPHDNITLNHAIEKTDQNLAVFQTGISAAAHVTLDTE